MKITQVQCKDVVLSIGDTVLVKFKPLDGEDELPERDKIIKIAAFKPYEDGSDDIWMIDANGEIYADENFVSMVNYIR
jgi:hypothetical protein